MKNKRITTCEGGKYICKYNKETNSFESFNKEMKSIRKNTGNLMPKKGFEKDCIVKNGLNKLKR